MKSQKNTSFFTFLPPSFCLRRRTVLILNSNLKLYKNTQTCMTLTVEDDPLRVTGSLSSPGGTGHPSSQEVASNPSAGLCAGLLTCFE